MRRLSRIVTLRIGAAGAAAAVALTAPALTGPAQAAQAPVSASGAAVAAPTTSTARARGAAGWLGRQFVDGNHLEVVFGGTAYPDAGLTLDAVLALAAAKVGNDEGGDAIRWLASGDQLATYIGDGTTESYAGAHAKVVLALQVRGRDPKRFAGRAVLAELKALQQPSGRFTDRSAFGDFSNAFSQSLAVIALERAGEASDIPADYLAGQACPDGGVPETLDAATCTSQVDATGLAIQAFVATGRTTAAEKALVWLGTQQAADGGFGNSNSTGLAAAAFAIGGRTAQARAAREYLGSLQQGCRAPLATRGAIGYQPGPFDPATAVRATTQAVLGLAGTDLGTLKSAGSRNRLPVLNCGGNP